MVFKGCVLSTLCLVGTLTAQIAVVSGRVVAEAGQQTLAASITVVTTEGGVRLKTVTTDDRGVFSVQLAPGAVSIVARADGYASEQRDLLVRPGRANLPLTLSLHPAGTLSGRVVDGSGAGIARARVWLDYGAGPRTWHLSEEIGGQETDASGQFTIPVVARGRPFVLHAHQEGWLLSSSQTIAFRTQELRGVLLLLSRRGATVAGRVLDAGGRPISGAQVSLRAAPRDEEFTARQRTSFGFAHFVNRFAVSGEDGAYRFEAVPSGRVIVTGQAQNRKSTAETETTAGRQTTVDLQLR